MGPHASHHSGRQSCHCAIESCTVPFSLVGVMADREVERGPLDECLHCTMKLYTRYFDICKVAESCFATGGSLQHGVRLMYITPASALSPRQLAHRLVHQLANITHQDNIPSFKYIGK